MNSTATTLILLAVAALPLAGDVPVNIRLGAGHPLARPSRVVVVRPSRVVVAPRLVYAPPLRWQRSTIVMPGRERLTWQDTDTIHRRESWVDTHLAVNERGDRLLLQIQGRVQVDFAEVHFENGQVRVVDFNETTLATGIYPLLDFADGRKVDSVRVIARSLSGQAKLTAILAK
jgi:hypothetical protein